jgi:hypothetical protein
MTGQEGEGRGGWYYDGECLFDDGRDDDEYDDDNKYGDAEDGRGHAEKQMTGGNPTTTVATLSVGVLWRCGVEDVDRWPPRRRRCHPR